jgi:hypothetical protein
VSKARSMPTAMQEAPGAHLIISKVRAGDTIEQVTIVNRGQVDQPLTGWALASLHGLEVFRFPDGTVLPADGEIRVLSGEAARAFTARDLVWTRESVWSNRSDSAILFDNQGHEVTRLTYPRPTIREDRPPKLKVLEHDREGYHLRDWDEFVDREGISARL